MCFNRKEISFNAMLVLQHLRVVKTNSICRDETQRRNKLADDSGGQIKVLGLNGIVGQMTRHCCLSAHSHPLVPQKNTPPPAHLSLPSSISSPLPSTALYLPQRREYFIFSDPTASLMQTHIESFMWLSKWFLEILHFSASNITSTLGFSFSQEA